MFCPAFVTANNKHKLPETIINILKKLKLEFLLIEKGEKNRNVGLEVLEM